MAVSKEQPSIVITPEQLSGHNDKYFKAAELLDEACDLMDDSIDALGDIADVLNDIDIDPCFPEDVDESNEEEEESEDDINDVSTPTGSVPAYPSVLKYAPKMPTKSGTYDLYPISLSWTDTRGASANQLRNMAKSAAENIERLSNGAIKFNIKSPGIYRTGQEKHASYVGKASDKARAKFTDHGSKYRALYAIVNNSAKKRSHAGRKTASLLTPLITTAGHEILHLLGLKHANRYAKITKGRHKGELEFQSSRDGSSIMSIYSSRDLTAPQKYSQGWYEEGQVAMYEIGDPAITYSLQPVCDPASSDYVNAVHIPREDQTPLFLSLFESKANKKGEKEKLLALHVGEKGGSTRLQVFKQHAEIDDLSFDTVAQESDHWDVTVGPKIGPTP